MTVHAFPFRAAGRVLAAAMAAADEAARAEAERLDAIEDSLPLDFDTAARVDWMAERAASAVLWQLTSDPEMVRIIARAFAQKIGRMERDAAAEVPF